MKSFTSIGPIFKKYCTTKDTDLDNAKRSCKILPPTPLPSPALLNTVTLLFWNGNPSPDLIWKFFGKLYFAVLDGFYS